MPAQNEHAWDPTPVEWEIDLGTWEDPPEWPIKIIHWGEEPVDIAQNSNDVTE